MSKAKEGVVEPWKQPCELRPEIRQQQLTLAKSLKDYCGLDTLAMVKVHEALVCLASR
jgi:hypothetical protein